jgi:hypothetical protein
MPLFITILHLLTICSSLPADVFLGATVHACRKAGRHFLVMEEDDDIYKCVIQPLIMEPVVEVNKRPRLDDKVGLGVPEEEVEPSPPTIMRLNRYST